MQHIPALRGTTMHSGEVPGRRPFTTCVLRPMRCAASLFGSQAQAAVFSFERRSNLVAWLVATAGCPAARGFEGCPAPPRPHVQGTNQAMEDAVELGRAIGE